MKFNQSQSNDFNDRDNHNKTITSGENSPFAAAVRRAARKNIHCKHENNPLRELMEEEGASLSPSQVAKEML